MGRLHLRKAFYMETACTLGLSTGVVPGCLGIRTTYSMYSSVSLFTESASIPALRIVSTAWLRVFTNSLTSLTLCSGIFLPSFFLNWKKKIPSLTFVAVGGFSRGRENRNSLPLERRFAYFPAAGKVCRRRQTAPESGTPPKKQSAKNNNRAPSLPGKEI